MWANHKLRPGSSSYVAMICCLRVGWMIKWAYLVTAPLTINSISTLSLLAYISTCLVSVSMWAISCLGIRRLHSPFLGGRECPYRSPRLTSITSCSSCSTLYSWSNTWGSCDVYRFISSLHTSNASRSWGQRPLQPTPSHKLVVILVFFQLLGGIGNHHLVLHWYTF